MRKSRSPLEESRKGGGGANRSAAADFCLHLRWESSVLRGGVGARRRASQPRPPLHVSLPRFAHFTCGS